MAYSRYNNRATKYNNADFYKEIFERRGVPGISHYKTALFNYDFDNNIANFELKETVWKNGDRLYRLSQEYYNSVNFWWVIGFINQKPTDSHYSVGDVVLVPYPLEEVLKFIGAV